MTQAPDGWRYGLLGLPLAFAALPLYVQFPAYYAREFGVALAPLGALLLAVRLGDALVDPWIGAWLDRMFQRSPPQVLRVAAFAAALLAAGFALLFLPAVRAPDALLAWAGIALLLTSAGYSVLTVAHQAWGAMLASADAQRARIVAWREGLGLLGVLLAAVLPSVGGWPATATVLAVALGLAWAAWSRSRRPAEAAARSAAAWPLPLRHAAFRRLLAVFVANGIASAVPATLRLFFVRDRLQASAAWEAGFLATYFVCAALSMPLWLRAVARLRLERSWRAGMLLAVAGFAGAMALGPGDAPAFVAICAACGAALGSDLALPAALLARVVVRTGEHGREGLFFGWWNFAGKLNLALAAGLALPLLAACGYTPGDSSPASLAALGVAYCVLPCGMKLGAVALLHRLLIRNGEPA
jgi:Na+/melibiose symporter-like transporter